MIIMVTKTITLREHNRKIERYNQLIRKGFKPIIKKNYFRVGLGVGVFTISILTPFTNWFLIPLSLFILGFSLRDLEEVKRKIKNKIRGCRVFYSTPLKF